MSKIEKIGILAFAIAAHLIFGWAAISAFETYGVETHTVAAYFVTQAAIVILDICTYKELRRAKHNGR